MNQIHCAHCDLTRHRPCASVCRGDFEGDRNTTIVDELDSATT